MGFLDSFNPKKLIWEVIVTRLSNEKLMKKWKDQKINHIYWSNTTIQKVAYAKIKEQEWRYLQLL